MIETLAVILFISGTFIVVGFYRIVEWFNFQKEKKIRDLEREKIKWEIKKDVQESSLDDLVNRSNKHYGSGTDDSSSVK